MSDIKHEILVERIILLQLKFQALESVYEDYAPELHVRYARKFNELVASSIEFKNVQERIKILEQGG